MNDVIVNSLDIMWPKKGRIDFGKTKFNRPIPDEEEDELFTAPIRALFKATTWKICSFDVIENLTIFSWRAGLEYFQSLDKVQQLI